MEWAEFGYGILLLIAFAMVAFAIDIWIVDVPEIEKKKKDKENGTL